VASTDSIAAYPLSAGVRARREDFGLLFYNAKDAKLTFVKCRDLLEVHRTDKGGFELKPVSSDPRDLAKALSYLASLQKKGLVREPSSCI
jgi:putative mycofactocin binding protein MftB